MGEESKNYLKAKAKVALGKVYLAKKDQDKGETLINMAADSIKEEYGADHPLLACKFNQSCVEALNTRAESTERHKLIADLCKNSVEISTSHYGSESIFMVRPLYTLYTA